MVLNYIWVGFFLIAFVVALVKLVFLGDYEVFPAMMKSTFDMSKTAFELSIGLTGAMALWLGIMRIGEKAGIIRVVYKLVGPFFKRLFPGIPENHPVMTPMLMNFSANMMGLDNAATPLGLKAMEGLQELNPKKDSASNEQIMFLVLNTSGLTLLPISIMVYRQQAGATDPSDVFLPILLATFFSTFVGLVITAIYQRIKLYDPVILAYLLGMLLLVGGIIYTFLGMEPEAVGKASSTLANVILFSVIAGIISLGAIRKVNVYDSFIEGAKEAFSIAIKIIPYLVAMLVAIGVFRSSGTLDWITSGIKSGVLAMGWNADFVDALPTALMKPLSGSGARGMMVETMNTHGADSLPGYLASIMQGSTETTLFVLALYFGAVGVRKTRYAIVCGLLADLAGIIAAIVLSYLFFVPKG
ncbi:membrane protein [Fulvitalea axinellae]|uniref:Membrane protein n=1 Tax=Fulvitalea axinellae TaxID=1182444 RepID=A0AAU9D3J7_9BACT|nr:membrane protein [Fulvitalea axinellae]